MRGTIDGLAQVSIYVRDIEKSKIFYSDNLGFQLVHELILPVTENMSLGFYGCDLKIAFMDISEFRIELVQAPDYTIKNDGPIDHITLKVTGIEEVIDNLKSKGIKFETQDILHGGYVGKKHSKFILFRGPDGEHIELTEIY